MNYEIVKLIDEKLKNRESRVCSLFENDPLFNMAYQQLRNFGDKPEIILDILCCACECKNHYISELTNMVQTKSIYILKKDNG